MWSYNAGSSQKCRGCIMCISSKLLNENHNWVLKDVNALRIIVTLAMEWSILDKSFAHLKTLVATIDSDWCPKKRNWSIAAVLRWYMASSVKEVYNVPQEKSLTVFASWLKGYHWKWFAQMIHFIECFLSFSTCCCWRPPRSVSSSESKSSPSTFWPNRKLPVNCSMNFQAKRHCRVC